MGLKLTVLGRCGSYPGPGGACSGYLVRSDTTTIWLDAGSGSMANLQHHVGLESVDAVVLSHEHADHWTDIEGFHVACAYGLGRRDIPVYGPSGLKGHMPGRDTFDWRAVASGEEVLIGDIAFRFSRTDHPVETLGMRISSGGRTLGYTADTGNKWSISELGDELDLVLSEATLTTEQEHTIAGDVHLSARQAGLQAKDAGAAKLLLTHFWPTNDPEQARIEGTEAFGQPADIAVENQEYDV